MAKTSSLHELLAVEGDLEGEHKKITNETTVAFLKKAHLFSGYLKRVKAFDENEPEFPEERTQLESTVDEKLEYNMKSAIRYFDAILQKESTNQNANADLEVDGVSLGVSLPATFLLGMESRLKRIREVYSSIPTLAPGNDWIQDPNERNGVFKTNTPYQQTRTKKIIRPVVLYEATEHHPAQVEKVSSDERIGITETIEWSGMISPAKKSKYLAKIDTLIRAVKKARQKANKTEIVKRQIGKEIFDFIHAE